jgi:hypothetical protein
MPQRESFVATGILVFDFELFIGGLFKKRADNIFKLSAPINLPFRYYVSRPHCSIVDANITDQAGQEESSNLMTITQIQTGRPFILCQRKCRPHVG